MAKKRTALTLGRLQTASTKRRQVGGFYGVANTAVQVVSNPAFRIAIEQFLTITAVKGGLYYASQALSGVTGKKYLWVDRFMQWLPTVFATYIMVSSAPFQNPVIGAVAASFLRYVDNYIQSKRDEVHDEGVASQPVGSLPVPVPTPPEPIAPPMAPAVQAALVSKLGKRSGATKKKSTKSKVVKKVTKRNATVQG